jgi:DNA-binding GntR family transcriptional regulator
MTDSRPAVVSPLSPYRPLYQDAYDVLREAIIAGRLEPGDRIVEADIARQLAISRAPVREAVRKLERDGLVVYRPRRGTVVVKLSPDEVADVYSLRAHLEAYAVRLAVVHASPDDFAALEQLIEEMLSCAERDDLPGVIAADVQFHARLCQASGSRRLPLLWDGLNPQSWTLLTGLKAVGYTLRHIAERHRPVLAALESRDPDRAEAEIRRHILELANDVLARLDAEGEPESDRSGKPPTGRRAG